MLQPLQDRVLIRQLDAKEKSPGGIFIPDLAKEKPTEGTVIAVGPGKQLENGDIKAMDVKPGDHVMLGKYSGQTVVVDGKDHMVVTIDEILAIIQ